MAQNWLYTKLIFDTKGFFLLFLPTTRQLLELNVHLLPCISHPFNSAIAKKNSQLFILLAVSFTLPEQGGLLEEVLFVELCQEEAQKLLSSYKLEATRLLPTPAKRKRHNKGPHKHHPDAHGEGKTVQNTGSDDNHVWNLDLLLQFNDHHTDGRKSNICFAIIRSL